MERAQRVRARHASIARAQPPKRSGAKAAMWGLATLTAALLGAGAAAGAGTSGERLDSFAGSCSVQGTDTFTPPVTNTVQDLTVTYDATGTCTGTLDHANVSNAPVKVHLVAHSHGSCSQAQASGQSAITFADATTIRTTVDYTSTGTEIDLTFHGQRSGSAHGHATSLTNRTPPDVALNCAGAGNKQIPLDLSLTTDSALTSARAPVAPKAPPGSPAAPPPPPISPVAAHPIKRLRLSVSPHSTRVGRRRTFVLRVTTKRGLSVSGAVVRFAGRRALTGRRGTARLAVTLRRPGRYTAHATKPGFRTTRRTVLARSRR